MKPLPRFPGLEGLRGIAVLAVFGHHAAIPGFSAGYLGVDVFFVLSGFLISAILLHEHDAEKRIAIGRFYARRALRIVPALLLLLAGLTILTFTLPMPWKRSLFLHSLPYAATFTTQFQLMREMRAGPFAHLWSLSWEALFYLALPWLLAWALRTWQRGRWLAYGCIAWMVAGALARTLVFGLGWNGSAPLLALAINRVDGFAVGVLCAFALRRGAGIGRFWAAIAVPMLCLCFPLTAASWALGLGSTLAMLATALVVLCSGGARAPGFLARLDASPLGWFGTVSYGLYLWHPPLAPVFNRLIDQAALRWGAYFAASVALAAASYYLLERPLLQRSRKALASSGTESASNQQHPSATPRTEASGSTERSGASGDRAR